MPYNDLFWKKIVKITERWGRALRPPSSFGDWWLCP